MQAHDQEVEVSLQRSERQSDHLTQRKSQISQQPYRLKTDRVHMHRYNQRRCDGLLAVSYLHDNAVHGEQSQSAPLGQCYVGNSHGEGIHTAHAG